MQSEDNQRALCAENQRDGVAEGNAVGAFRDAPGSRRYSRGAGGYGRGRGGRGGGGMARKVDNWRWNAPSGNGEDRAPDAPTGEAPREDNANYDAEGGRGRTRWPASQGGRGRYPVRESHDAEDTTHHDPASDKPETTGADAAYEGGARTAYRPRRGGYRGGGYDGGDFRRPHRGRDDFRGAESDVRHDDDGDAGAEERGEWGGRGSGRGYRGRGRYTEDDSYGGNYRTRRGRGRGGYSGDYAGRERYAQDEAEDGDSAPYRRRQAPLQPFEVDDDSHRRGARRGGAGRAEDAPEPVAAAEPTSNAASPLTTPPPAEPTAAARQRVMRAPHLRRNCHDETEILELFEHHHKQTGISLDNYANIPVDMVPRDIMAVEDFHDLAVEPFLAANIDRCGYKKPTPVQRYGIPVALAGNDLMACAQTGSGKTAAFLIPVVQYILRHGVSPARRGVSYPIALILAPTRELALQIYDEVRKLTFRTDIFYDVVYGGTPYPTRFENDVLVACPGRLKDIFDRGSVSFQAIKFLILDEADRMLEMGFEEQIEYLVASRYTDMPRADERQTLMFSATFPQRILNLAKRYLRKQYYLLTVGRVGSTTKNITQLIEKVPDNEKIDRLFELIYEHKKTDLVLIFVETKKAAEDLHRELNKEHIPSSTIHGDRRQQDRERALVEFKSGQTPILVATDVAARGLDIPDVSHVIQFDLPTELDDYIHRIGRTGRAGNKGTATCFYNRNNRKLCLDLYRYMTEHDQEIPPWFKQEVEMVEGEALLSRGGAFGRRRDFNSGPSKPNRNDEDNNATWGEAGPSRGTHTRGKGKKGFGDKNYDDGGF